MRQLFVIPLANEESKNDFSKKRSLCINIYNERIWSIFVKDIKYSPNHYCRVCGLFSEDPWWDDLGCPSDDICPCCGVEAGYGDSALSSIRKYRKEWLASGAKWWRPKEKPQDWSREDRMKQLKQIPEEFL